MEEIEPKEVIRFFMEISKIPRKSGQEREIAEYLVDFAKKRNLSYMIDNNYNVIIKKQATKGKEKVESLAFQAHTDMICEKIEGYEHDFSKDCLKLYREGDYIKAKGTTLGADNGIGVAFLLAILDSKTIKTPKIEAIFTVQEETTMLGAILLDMEPLESKRIISLDNGKEGKILVSSAECKEWKCKIKGNKEVNKEKNGYELRYYNFLGGHSGGNIGEEKRGNPIKLAAELLKKVSDIQLTEFQGGSKVNVIPRDCIVRFVTKEKDVFSLLENKIKEQKEFYGEEVKIEVKSTSFPKEMYCKDTTEKVLGFLSDFQNGAMRKDKTGNVIQSGNLGAIEQKENDFEISFSERSNNKEEEKQYLEDLQEKIEKYNLEKIWYQELKGVEKKEKSRLVTDCKNIYFKLYQKEMEEVISQGVVEGGFFLAKKKDCEYVCIGANTFDVHSPKERVSITSIQRTWEFLKKILEEIE